MTEKKIPMRVEPRPPRAGQLFIGLIEIAWITGLSYDWLTRKQSTGKTPNGKVRDRRCGIDLLMSDYGFPAARPFPGQRHWSLKKVQEWIDEEHNRAALDAPRRAKEPDYDALLAERNAKIGRSA